MVGQDIKVTHEGEWLIEDIGFSVDCYVTNNGRRLMSLRGTARAMNLKGAGSTALARNLNSKWIEPYLSEGLIEWLINSKNNTHIKIKGIKGEFIPFDGDLFVDLCKAYISAQRDGVFDNLSGNQNEIADRLLSIMSVFAKVGITAIIDEVTGYQEEREKDELQKILAKYVRQEYLPWTRRFPEQYYLEMFRLKGWEYKGKAKSPLVGQYTNRFVYDVLPEKVLEELQKKNPLVKTKTDKIYRKQRHHQYLTEDSGIPHLDKHLVSVITLMRACDTWEEFEKKFEKVFLQENGA